MSKRFSLLLPPPNITGSLHLGHVWNAFLQDCLFRFHDPKGKTSWIKGLDHAGLSFHIMASKKLNTTSPDSESLMNLANEQMGALQIQLNSLNLAGDRNFRYTMDDGSVQLVNQVFAKLSKEGLVYRAKKVLFWDFDRQCPISDSEVVYTSQTQSLYYLNYALEGGGKISVATTQPGTILFDVALFVNPNDPRHSALIGKNAIIPVLDRSIPILGDEHVELNFGSGVLKCTPTNDVHDFQLALKHGLLFQDLVSKKGTIQGLHQDWDGLTMVEAESFLLKKLEDAGHISKVEVYEGEVPLRNGERIYSLASEQWFLKSSSLAFQTIPFLNQLKIYPLFYRDHLVKIMKNMTDWCISRQTPWGIPIPGSSSGDVFDTWFSSSLWPITCFLNSQNLELRNGFPVSVLVCGKDILLSWISRMIFMSVYLEKKLPFKAVFLHGLILDEHGKKMSKSIGNGISHTELDCSLDALRLFLLSSVGDIRFSREKIKTFERFLIKYKNANHFVQMFLSQHFCAQLSDVDEQWFECWISYRLTFLEERMEKLMNGFQLNLAVSEVMSFFREEYCNRYLEMCKLSLDKVRSAAFLKKSWESMMSLLQIFMPNTVVGEFNYSVSSIGDLGLHGVFRFLSLSKEIPISNLDAVLEMIKPSAKAAGLAAELRGTLNSIGGWRFEQRSVDDTKLVYFPLVDSLLKVGIFIPLKDICVIEKWLVKTLSFLTDEINRIDGLMMNKEFVSKASDEKIKLEKDKQTMFRAQHGFYSGIIEEL